MYIYIEYMNRIPENVAWDAFALGLWINCDAYRQTSCKTTVDIAQLYNELHFNMKWDSESFCQKPVKKKFTKGIY